MAYTDSQAEVTEIEPRFNCTTRIRGRMSLDTHWPAQPAIFFAEPNRLPNPDRLGTGVVVLDIAFALPVPPADFPLHDLRSRRWIQREIDETTLRFIDTLGPRLLLWVDHHEHKLWPRFQGDSRFLLCPADQAPACAMLVTESLFENPALACADTLICHGDIDGLLSAARLFRRGAWPYRGAEQDAIAADTRRGSLGSVGTLLDHALKARRDEGLRRIALRWLLTRHEEAHSELKRAAAAYTVILGEVRRSAARSRDIGKVRIVDLRDADGPHDLTALLHELQGEDRVGVVLHQSGGQEYLEVGCRMPGVHLPRLLGLPAGSPGRIRLAAVHLGELIDAVGPTDNPCIDKPRHPRHALVEIVRRCNLHCPICPVGNGLARRLPDMSWDTYCNVIDQFAASLESMTLHNYGEPLLHRQVGQFIRYAKQSGVKHIALTTNGNHLPEALAEELVDARLDFIRFSVDTSDAAAYRQYRRGGELDRVLANIALLARTRVRRGATLPHIEAQAMLMRLAEEQAGEFEQVLMSAGADQVRWKTFNAFMSGEKLLDQGAAFVPLNVAYRRHRELVPRPAASRSEMRLCRWPWDRLVVLADGTVTPCCQDFNGDYPLGTAETGEADAIWDTATRRGFMVRRILQPESFAMCRRCPSGVPHLALRREAVPAGNSDEE